MHTHRNILECDMAFILQSFNNTATFRIETLIDFIPCCTHSKTRKIMFVKVVNEAKECKSKEIKQRNAEYIAI